MILWHWKNLRWPYDPRKYCGMECLTLMILQNIDVKTLKSKWICLSLVDPLLTNKIMILLFDPWWLNDLRKYCGMTLWSRKKLWDSMLDPCDAIKSNCDDSKWRFFNLGDLFANAIWNFINNAKSGIFLYLNAIAIQCNQDAFWCLTALWPLKKLWDESL